jgi:hypothetical protein
MSSKGPTNISLSKRPNLRKPESMHQGSFVAAITDTRHSEPALLFQRSKSSKQDARVEVSELPTLLSESDDWSRDVNNAYTDKLASYKKDMHMIISLSLTHTHTLLT